MEHLEGTYEFQYIHNNQDLTSNLRKFRNNIAMSQKQVASILDIERSTYTYCQTYLLYSRYLRYLKCIYSIY